MSLVPHFMGKKKKCIIIVLFIFRLIGKINKCHIISFLNVHNDVPACQECKCILTPSFLNSGLGYDPSSKWKCLLLPSYFSVQKEI